MGHFKPQLPLSQLIIQRSIHTHAHTRIHAQTHACHTHFHGYSELLWPSTFAAFPVHFPVRSSRRWREYLPHRAACQRAPRTQNRHRDGACPRSPHPPAPNHYAHNHLKAKEDGEHICMVCVTGARSLDCKRRLAPYSLDVYLSRSFNLSLTLNDACMNDEIIAVIVFVE